LRLALRTAFSSASAGSRWLQPRFSMHFSRAARRTALFTPPFMESASSAAPMALIMP
jgi:hypothetical protein